MDWIESLLCSMEFSIDRARRNSGRFESWCADPTKNEDFSWYPLRMIENPTIQCLRELERVLPLEIRGQDHVLPRVISLLRRGQLGLSKSGRPRGSFLFLGPTGVGKTELTQVFTKVLLGTEALVRFDMSEFQTQESLGLLLGSKSTDRGFFGMACSRVREGTLLFDEVEKAHPRVMDVFLQILDAARVTVATGETLDLSNFYVVMTSNIGSAELMSLQHSSDATLERHVLTRAQQGLRPEIFARINEKLVFGRLTYDHQLEIAQKFLDRELEFLAAKGIRLRTTPEVLPFLVRKGFHPKLGARPIRDTVEKQVGDAIARAMLEGAETSYALTVSSNGDGLVLPLSQVGCNRTTDLNGEF
jgi:ATP-dependent Clp protease ATP-binding subunit ClpA